MRVVAQRLEHRDPAAALLHHGVERAVPGLVVDELVHVQLRHHGAAHPVIGVAFLLPGLHVLAVRVPEVGRELQHPGVEEVAVLQHLVVRVILGGERERARLDPHVDVLGDEDHLALRVGALQVAHHREDLVVHLAHGEGGGEVAGDGFRLQEQAPRGRFAGLGRQRDAPADVARDAAGFGDGGDDLVEEAARLAGVA